jgi:hypothetical protein
MSKQDYTPYNIYQKRKMAEKKEDATPLKSIYAKNHNMFMNAVPDLRNGIDIGFADGEKKRTLPVIDKEKKEDDKKEEQKKVNLTKEQQTAVTNAGKAISGFLGG